MAFDAIVDLLKNVIDVLLVWLVLYFVLKSLSKNLKMVLLFKGILFILILKIFSDLFNLVTIGFLLKMDLLLNIVVDITSIKMYMLN